MKIERKQRREKKKNQMNKTAGRKNQGGWYRFDSMLESWFRLQRRGKKKENLSEGGNQIRSHEEKKQQLLSYNKRGRKRVMKSEIS